MYRDSVVCKTEGWGDLGVGVLALPVVSAMRDEFARRSWLSGTRLVFVIRTDGRGYQRLYSFDGQANHGDGSKSIDKVILVNRWLYGMTTEGGIHNAGAISR